MSSNPKYFDEDNDDFDNFDDLYEDDLESPAAEEGVEEEEEEGDAFTREMFGPTGRGSPAMGRQSPRDLSRNADKSLRNVGFKDETHLKDTTAWEPQRQPQPQPKSKPKSKSTPKAVVRSAVRTPMVKAKPSQENRNQFSDNSKYDQDAQDAADKFWLSMGHLPLRHRVGEEYEKMMQERARPQRNKGGTRKRNTRRRNKRSSKRNKRSSRKSSNKKSRNKSRK